MAKKKPKITIASAIVIGILAVVLIMMVGGKGLTAKFYEGMTGTCPEEPGCGTGSGGLGLLETGGGEPPNVIPAPGTGGGQPLPGEQPPQIIVNNAPENNEATCGDGRDNDQNGWTDCADPGCTGQVCKRVQCPPQITTGTGFISTCVGGACIYTTNDCHENPAVPLICLDGLDNDNDGLIDCYDADCDTGILQVFACRDGMDNDMDGVNDCSDSDCDKACNPQCQFGKELNCFDNFDNDRDGRTDTMDCDDCPHIDIIPTGVTKTKTANGYDYKASVKNQGNFDEQNQITVVVNETSNIGYLGSCFINSLIAGVTDSCTVSSGVDKSKVQVTVSVSNDCDKTNNIATYDV